MRKTFGMNRHQKAAHRPGEVRVSRKEIPGLLAMAESADPEDRLTAARYMCPCHVRARIPAVWEALYRLMEDPDPRVRRQAWHTIEDGGKPGDETVAERLAAICRREADPKVRRFAERTLDRTVDAAWRGPDPASLLAASRPAPRQRGKCDFCGESGVCVERDLETMIPTGDLPRPALICDQCARAA